MALRGGRCAAVGQRLPPSEDAGHEQIGLAHVEAFFAAEAGDVVALFLHDVDVLADDASR